MPENSLPSFEAALEFGAGVECDVRLSSDGEVMVFHDHELRRLCGTEGVLESTRAGVLAAMRLLDTRATIPWLSELLDLVAGRVPILIEAKVWKKNAKRLAAAIANDLADYAGPVGVMSFDPRVSWWFARNVPYRHRGLVVSARASAFERWTAVGYGSPNFLSVQRTLLGSRWAAKARTKRNLYSWTIATAEQRAQATVHADALIWEGDGRPGN